MKKLLPILLCLAFLCGCGISAPSRDAGFAELDSPSWREVDTAFTLSLGPTMLRFAAAMMDEDPHTQALLRSLQGVRVKVYDIEGDPLAVAADINDMSQDLRHHGWEPVVRVTEADETTHVLMKISEGEIVGLTVLTSDQFEAVMVNVMGDLQPALFTEAMVALDVPAPEITVAQAQ